MAQCTTAMDSVSGIMEEGSCEIGAVGGAMEEGLRFRGSGEGSCHAQYATLSKRNSKVPQRIDPHIETLLQGGYHYINITQ